MIHTIRFRKLRSFDSASSLAVTETGRVLGSSLCQLICLSSAGRSTFHQVVEISVSSEVRERDRREKTLSCPSFVLARTKPCFGRASVWAPFFWHDCELFPVGRVLPPVGKRRHHTPRRSNATPVFFPSGSEKGSASPYLSTASTEMQKPMRIVDFFRPPSGCALCNASFVTPPRSHLPLPLIYTKVSKRGKPPRRLLPTKGHQSATGGLCGHFFLRPIGKWWEHTLELRTNRGAHIYRVSQTRPFPCIAKTFASRSAQGSVLFLFCLA